MTKRKQWKTRGLKKQANQENERKWNQKTLSMGKYSAGGKGGVGEGQRANQAERE